MNLSIMRYNSDPNKIGKSKTTLSSLSGTLRANTSIIDPVIVIEGSLPATANYLYINEFERYYFINNIVAINSDLYEVHCHVDVLDSFASEILANMAVVARQEFKYSLYVDDQMYKVYQNPEITTQVFPSGFSGQSYVMAVAGG